MTKATEQDWKQVRARTPDYTTGGLFHWEQPDGSWVHATIAELNETDGVAKLEGYDQPVPLSELTWIGPGHVDPA